MSEIVDYTALDRQVLVVAVKRIEDAWCAYIGAVPGENHRNELDQVKRHGAKLSRRVAEACFPNIEKRIGKLPYAW